MILTCSEEENARRLILGTRGAAAGNTKLTNINVLKAVRAYNDNGGHEPHRFKFCGAELEEGVALEVEVDVTEKSAEEVAAIVFEAMRGAGFGIVSR